MKSALELWPPGPFSVCRLGDSVMFFGLGLHLSLGRLAFAWGVGDERSALPA